VVQHFAGGAAIGRQPGIGHGQTVECPFLQHLEPPGAQGRDGTAQHQPAHRIGETRAGHGASVLFQSDRPFGVCGEKYLMWRAVHDLRVEPSRGAMGDDEAVSRAGLENGSERLHGPLEVAGHCGMDGIRPRAGPSRRPCRRSMHPGTAGSPVPRPPSAGRRRRRVRPRARSRAGREPAGSWIPRGPMHGGRTCSWSGPLRKWSRAGGCAPAERRGRSPGRCLPGRLSRPARAAGRGRCFRCCSPVT